MVWFPFLFRSSTCYSCPQLITEYHKLFPHSLSRLPRFRQSAITFPRKIKIFTMYFVIKNAPMHTATLELNFPADALMCIKCKFNTISFENRGKPMI